MGINKELLYSDAKQDNAMRLVCEKQKGHKRIECMLVYSHMVNLLNFLFRVLFICVYYDTLNK